MVPVPSDLMRNTVAWGGQSEGETGCLVLELPAPIALPRLGFEPCKATVALCDQRGQPTGNHRGPRCSDFFFQVGIALQIYKIVSQVCLSRKCLSVFGNVCSKIL